MTIYGKQQQKKKKKKKKKKQLKLLGKQENLEAEYCYIASKTKDFPSCSNDDPRMTFDLLYFTTPFNIYVVVVAAIF